MKKLYALVLIVFHAPGFAQVVTIPDANFKAALLSHSPVIDLNANGEIETTEAAQVTSLNLTNKNITSLAGLENFSSLTQVSCSYNQISTFDFDLPTLSFLNAEHNQITAINTGSLPGLQMLFLNFNQLTEINLQPCPDLNMLSCAVNLLEAINLCGTQVAWLECDSNPNLISAQVKNGVVSGMLWGDPPVSQLSFGSCPQLVTVCYDSGELEAIQYGLNTPNVSFVTDCQAGCGTLNSTNAQKEQFFTLAPNPVQDVLQIKAAAGIVMQSAVIYNAVGQVVYRGTIEQIGPIAIIDTAALAAGTYYIEMISSKGKFNRKIIKL